MGFQRLASPERSEHGVTESRMSATVFICPNCGVEVSVEPQHLGVRLKCPHCRKPFITDAPPQSPGPTASAAWDRLAPVRQPESILQHPDQVPFEEFKERLFATDDAFKSYRAAELKRMYLDRHQISLTSYVRPVPASVSATRRKVSSGIFIAKSGKATGPFSEDQINSMLDSGMVSLADSSWHEGLTEWQPLQQVLNGPTLPSQVSLPVPPPATSIQTTTAHPGQAPSATLPLQTSPRPECNYCGRHADKGSMCSECCAAFGIPVGVERKEMFIYHLFTCCLWGVPLLLLAWWLGFERFGLTLVVVFGISSFTMPFAVLAQIWQCHPTCLDSCDPKKASVMGFLFMSIQLRSRKQLVYSLFGLANLLRAGQFILLWVAFDWQCALLGVFAWMYAEGVFFNPNLIILWSGPLTLDTVNSHEMVQVSKTAVGLSFGPPVAALISAAVTALLVFSEVKSANWSLLWLPVIAYPAGQWLCAKCIGAGQSA